MKPPKLTKKQLRDILINLLQLYLSKSHLKMKPVMNSMLNSLQSNKDISYKQFQSIINFIEREHVLKPYKRNQIIELFSPIIKDIIRNNNFEKPQNTLQPFLK